MGHVQFVLDLMTQPDQDKSLVKRSIRQSKINEPELQQLIALWNSQINYLNAQIARYKNQLGLRKTSPKKREINRSIVKEYQRQVVEFTTKRDAALVTLELNKEE